MPLSLTVELAVQRARRVHSHWPRARLSGENGTQNQIETKQQDAFRAESSTGIHIAVRPISCRLVLLSTRLDKFGTGLVMRLQHTQDIIARDLTMNNEVKPLR